MQIFADYIAPLTEWIQLHPHWAIVITFLISFTESLAIIGSIIPGSVTMTAIGILAGSGVMRLDLTYIAAILGAIAGDSFSYAIGFYYRESLVNIWPFNKYPNWLVYGQGYFKKHGGKSVLIGRFAGPLRSIIPVIAGMLGMQQWRFFVANVISAIGWAILYVTPGVLIGAASTQLSPEKASQLVIMILLLLVALWLVTMFTKWMILRINYYGRLQLHRFWLRARTNQRLSRFFNYLTPVNETNHSWTAILFLKLICSIIFLIVMIYIQNQFHYFARLNNGVYLFLQSVHVNFLDIIAVVCNQFSDWVVLITISVFCLSWFYKRNHSTALIFFCALLLSNIFFVFFISFIISHTSQQPVPFFQPIHLPINLLFATSLFTFLIGMVYTKSTYLPHALAIMLFLNGLATLYLGENILSDVVIAYLAGFSIGLLNWILFRIKRTRFSPIPDKFFIVALIIGFTIALLFNFQPDFEENKPEQRKSIILANTWWEQQQNYLPLYRSNRIGNRVSLLNIQYVGELKHLEESLKESGWQSYSGTFFTNLIKRTSDNVEERSMPLLPQLFENKRTTLIMTYRNTNPRFILVLRIWQSSYYINTIHEPIWIGSLHQEFKKKKSQNFKVQDPWNYLLPALKEFNVKKINVPGGTVNSMAIPTPPFLYLIKE